MKKFEAILLMIVLVIAVLLPGVAMVFGLGSILFTKPETFLGIVLYGVGVFGFVYGMGFLLTNKYTALPTKIILSILVAIFVVKSCKLPSGSDDCTPSRYVDC